MLVALGFAGLNRGHLDGAVRSAVGQIRLHLERALELGELVVRRLGEDVAPRLRELLAGDR